MYRFDEFAYFEESLHPSDKPPWLWCTITLSIFEFGLVVFYIYVYQ